MKSGSDDELRRVREEQKEINREMMQLQQKIGPIQQHLKKIENELIPFHGALMIDPNLKNANAIKIRDELSQSRQKLNMELTVIEQRLQALHQRGIELDKTKERLKIEQTRNKIEPLVLSKLAEITHVKWIEDENKYGKGVIASEPFDNLEKARQFKDLFSSQLDPDSSLQKSPRGEYHRIFASKEKVLEVLIEQERAGGHALDISYLFQDLADKPQVGPR